MKRRFVLQNDTRPGVPAPEAKLADLYCLDSLSLGGGQSLVKVWPKVLVNVVDDDPSESPSGLTDFFRAVGLKFVSKRFEVAMTPFLADVEFLPVIVNYRRKQIVGEFFAANALKRLEAIDIKASGAELDEEGYVADVETLALREDVLKGNHWCVLAELGLVVISEDVKYALEEAKCIGYEALPAERWKA